jgi:vacuolar-type H+-ATPase subunit F/Vma7
MRVFVIGDEDTVAGFGMAGVEGIVVEDASAAYDALKKSEEEGSDAVVIIPERIAKWVREEIDRIRYGTALPLIVEVPGIEGAEEGTPSLFRLVREAVGVTFDGE